MVYSKSSIKWSMKELRAALRARQNNEYDINIGVTGKRGDGKSSFIYKLLIGFKDFNPEKHQVYQREHVIKLLKTQKFGFCFDDEGINSGYKRNFQNKGQQELIKDVTAYRDNFNIYTTAIPFFYSLDKDLRELIFLHVHIIERGVAVLFMPIEESIHQNDPWDTKNNSRLEEKWQRHKQQNPNFRFPYYKLSTFAGYLFFGDLTDKQRERYLKIKQEKRHEAFLGEQEQQEKVDIEGYEKLVEMLHDDKLTQEILFAICESQNKRYSTVMSQMNRLLKDKGINKTVKQIWDKRKKEKLSSKTSDEIMSIVPSF